MVEKASKAVTDIHPSARVAAGNPEKSAMQSSGEAFVELFQGILSQVPCLSLPGALPEAGKITIAESKKDSTQEAVSNASDASADEVESEQEAVQGANEEIKDDAKDTAADDNPKTEVRAAPVRSEAEPESRIERKPAQGPASGEGEGPVMERSQAMTQLQQESARSNIQGKQLEAITEVVKDVAQKSTSQTPVVGTPQQGVIDAQGPQKAGQAQPIPQQPTAQQNMQQDPSRSQEKPKIALQPLASQSAAPRPETFSPREFTADLATGKTSEPVKAIPAIPVAAGLAQQSARSEARLAVDREALNIIFDRPVRDVPAAVGLSHGVEKKQVIGRETGLSQKAQSPTQAKIVNQIQEMIETATKLNNPNTISIRLEPVELGAVTVRVTQRADQIFARVIPESKEVEAVLRANMHEVVHTLTTSGFKADNIHVSIGREFPEHQLMNFERQGMSDRRMNGESGTRGRGLSEHSSQAAGEEKLSSESGWVA